MIKLKVGDKVIRVGDREWFQQETGTSDGDVLTVVEVKPHGSIRLVEVCGTWDENMFRKVPSVAPVKPELGEDVDPPVSPDEYTGGSVLLQGASEQPDNSGCLTVHR